MEPFHFTFLSPSLFQTTVLNKYLQEQMEGLTAKVFRTYNASITLQEQLEELTVGKSRFTRSSPLHHNDVIVFFQRTRLYLPRSCHTTEPTEQWPFSATIRFAWFHQLFLYNSSNFSGEWSLNFKIWREKGVPMNFSDCSLVQGSKNSNPPSPLKREKHGTSLSLSSSLLESSSQDI